MGSGVDDGTSVAVIVSVGVGGGWVLVCAGNGVAVGEGIAGADVECPRQPASDSADKTHAGASNNKTLLLNPSLTKLKGWLIVH
jgi:hypothetical protein